MALFPGPSQVIIAIDIGLRHHVEGQSLWWRVDLSQVCLLLFDQPVQEVQDMRLGGPSRIQRQFHSRRNGVFIVLQNQ